MTFTRIPLLILMTSLISLISGCSGGDAYVYNSKEFARESETFRSGILDREEVTVCYSKGATSPRQITKLARDECRQFGKSAQFREQSYQVCPLMTPIAAIYDCVGQATGSYSSGLK